MRCFKSLGFTALLLLAGSNVANAQTLQTRFDWTFLFDDPCNNEVVMADVVTHLLLLPDSTQRANQNGIAVGLTTGTLYEWNHIYQLEFEEIIGENSITFLTTGTGTIHLISHGAGPNLEVKTTLEIGSVVIFDPVTGFPIDFQNIDNTIQVIECRACADPD